MLLLHMRISFVYHPLVCQDLGLVVLVYCLVSLSESTALGILQRVCCLTCCV